MNNFNFTIVEGNLKSDPDCKENGTFFTVVSQYSFNNKKGEKVFKNENFLIKTTGTLSETCGKYLKAGSKVLVSGRLTKEFIEGKEVNFLSAK